eukprot:2069892-Amphidinium_carterae.3
MDSIGGVRSRYVVRQYKGRSTQTRSLVPLHLKLFEYCSVLPQGITIQQPVQSPQKHSHPDGGRRSVNSTTRRSGTRSQSCVETEEGIEWPEERIAPISEVFPGSTQ